MSEEQQKMVLENERLISFTIKNYHVYGDFEELKSVGMIGLCKGVKNYDESKGLKLSSFLVMCIRNELYMFIRKKKHDKTVSLDTPINENLTIEDVISDNTDIEKDVINKDQLNRIKKAIQNLSEIEKIIVTHLYEIDGAEKLNQKELSDIMNLSQSYI